MKTNRGFTLIEIMIVLAILAAVLAVGVPKLKLTQNALKKAARELTLLPRDIRNQARLKNSTYRIAIKMADKDYSYWVEMAPGVVYAPTIEEKKKAEEKARFDDEKPKEVFQKVTKYSKEEKKLPTGVKVLQVESLSQSEPVTTGTAYIYFSPSGLVEQATIQLANADDKIWTLIINPLTGHTDVVEKAISLKDLRTD